MIFKNETLKEIGKFGLDLAKIIFAVAILQPIVKNDSINLVAIFGSLAFIIGGVLLINKGVDGG